MPPAFKETARRVARGLVGAVSPALLRRIQLSRARAMYLEEPSHGPHRLLLEPTTGCNHRCVMCWDHSPRLAKQTPSWHMPFDRVAALLREMAAMGTEEVWLAGRGEPLVHPKAKDILKLIGDLGMRSIITTNAGVLTEELADQLCEWSLQQLSISVDSGTPATYAKVHGAPPEDRARILELMKHLSRRTAGKPRLLVSMVLSQANFREMLNLVRDAIDYGATGVVIGGMRPVPFDSTDLALSEGDWSQVRRDLEQAREMTQVAGIHLATENIPLVHAPRSQVWPYADMACFIGHRFTVIDVAGTVHGCCTCVNALGSLDDASFRDIWHSRPYRLYRKILSEMPTAGLTPPQCECRYGCGHVPENAALQRELTFTFPQSLPPSEFITRVALAHAVCEHLDAVLPPLARDFTFADLAPADASAVSRLRQTGIMGGGSMDGLTLFEPRRLVARGEFEDILARALAASHVDTEKAKSIIAQSRAGSGHPAEPLRQRDMDAWLSHLTSGLRS